MTSRRSGDDFPISRQISTPGHMDFGKLSDLGSEDRRVRGRSVERPRHAYPRQACAEFPAAARPEGRCNAKCLLVAASATANTQTRTAVALFSSGAHRRRSVRTGPCVARTTASTSRRSWCRHFPGSSSAPCLHARQARACCRASSPGRRGAWDLFDDFIGASAELLASVAGPIGEGYCNRDAERLAGLALLSPTTS